MLFKNDFDTVCSLAGGIRILALQAISGVGQGHVGGSLSIADVLGVLYGKVMSIVPTSPQREKRDFLVVSKGHSGPAVYAALALTGYFPAQQLSTMNRPLTNLPSHCDRLKTAGVDMTTGSLGQGASSAAGIALGNRIKGLKNFTYLILGDGECNEGQVWEAAEFAAHQKLGHLIAFVDWNKKQLDGEIEKISGGGNFEEKFRAFGWDAVTIDGHDLNAIYDAIMAAQNVEDKPSVIVLDTIKGKGFTKAENTANNHSMAVSKDDFKDAVQEIQAAMKVAVQELV